MKSSNTSHHAGGSALCLFLAALLNCHSAVSEEPATLGEPAENSVYSTRQASPDGIGKLYAGREIARTMSFHGAPWLNRPEREEEERLSLLVESLKLQPGQEVADIGAGSGVITAMLAKRVGDQGTVYAVDVQPEMILLLKQRMAKAQLQNVEPILGEVASPGLKENSIDLALLVDVYHEFSHPYEMTEELIKALRPGGRLVLVEYRAEDPAVPIKPLHKMSEKQARDELEQPAFSLRWIETIDVLPRQHILVFEKTPKQP